MSKISNSTLFPLSSPHRIIVPFVRVEFGGEVFGLTDKYNSFTKVRQSDFITGLQVSKYGSGAVNKYTLTMRYVITPETDPNYVDQVISKAQDRKIRFTYGDLTQPQYSYKDEEGLIENVVPSVDYKRNVISYTITAVSSTQLNYTQKKNFEKKIAKPSDEIINILYNNDFGLLELLPGMLNKDTVLGNGWIPVDDQKVEISEKIGISPMDYILYLVSLMKSTSGEFYFLKILDQVGDYGGQHFEIVSTASKATGKMMHISIGYPGSIPVYDFNVTQNTAIALMAEYRGKIEKGIYQDYGFSGDLITKNYYSNETNKGRFSDNAKNWWEKITNYPLVATLTTDGLYVPAEIVQSVYLDIFFFGKKYNHSGEYLILGQDDNISKDGYKTTLSLMRIKGDV